MTTTPRQHRHLARRLGATAVAAGALIGLAPVTAGVAGAQTPVPSTPTCIDAAAAKARAAAEIARRQTTLDELLVAIGGTSDPYGTNAEQSTELQSAKDGLAALGERIATNCYPDRSSLTEDVQAVLYDYRIYALRVPQTRVLESADHLGDARTKLGEVSATLAPKVTGNAAAEAALAAMDEALAQYDATVGAPPALVGAVAAVPGLEPAEDLGPVSAGIEAARADLTAGRQSLATAKAKAQEAVEALGG
jgi:hypothetical protein